MSGNAANEVAFTNLVGRLRKAVRRDFERRAASLCITASQFQVLHRLWLGDGIPTSTLAEEINSDGGTITGILDRLETRGLIRRQRGKDDRRTIRIFLTGAGKSLEEPLWEILSEVNARALAVLTEGEQERLLALLTRVERGLEEEPSAAPECDEAPAQHLFRGEKS